MISHRHLRSSDNYLCSGLDTFVHTLLLLGDALQLPYNRCLGIIFPVTSTKLTTVVTLMYFVQSLAQRLSILDTVLAHISSIIDIEVQWHVQLTW